MPMLKQKSCPDKFGFRVRAGDVVDVQVYYDNENILRRGRVIACWEDNTVDVRMFGGPTREHETRFQLVPDT